MLLNSAPTTLALEAVLTALHQAPCDSVGIRILSDGLHDGVTTGQVDMERSLALFVQAEPLGAPVLRGGDCLGALGGCFELVAPAVLPGRAAKVAELRKPQTHLQA